MRAAKSRRRQQAPASASVRTDPAAVEVRLPPERAFLLQLTDSATPSIGSFAGRLEHLASGTRRRFSGWDAFLAAVDALLAAHGGRTRTRRSVRPLLETTTVVRSADRSGRTARRPPETD